MPGQRGDVQTGASILVNSLTEQRAKQCGGFVVLPDQYSANGHSVATLRSTRLPQKHRPPRNIGDRGRCAYAAGTHQLPLFARDVARVSLPSFSYDAPGLDVRRDSGSPGQLRVPVWLVQPASHPVHALCAGSFAAVRGALASHDESELERPATDLHVACRISCTTARWHRTQRRTALR